MRIIIKARKKHDIKTLERYPDHIRKIFKRLARVYKFKAPDEITLRPLRRNNDQYAQSFTYGRAGYDGKNYWIAMNTELDCSLNTIAHEVAHLAEAIKFKKWGHGKKFGEILERALEVVNL